MNKSQFPIVMFKSILLIITTIVSFALINFVNEIHTDNSELSKLLEIIIKIAPFLLYIAIGLLTLSLIRDLFDLSMKNSNDFKLN